MIQDIFPTKIYKAKYQGDLHGLQDKVLPLLADVFSLTETDNQGSMRGDGLCSYNVKRDLFSWNELAEIKTFIQESANAYWSELGYRKDRHPYIVEMWANCYRGDSFIDAHNHAPAPLTASFYLKKPANSGNLVFEDPNATLLKHQPYDAILKRESYHLLFEQELDVEEGDLVIFPGYLVHKTRPNMSQDERIIIGANIG
jgi:uncharacterized protein (TIGR02466 family)